MSRPIEEFKRTAESVAAIANAQLVGDSATIITGLTLSSKEVQEGDLFIALPGEKSHGADFAAEAISLGAVAVLTDAVGAAKIKDVPVIISANPRRAAGVISAWFYSEPMRDLYSVGVTGTNGKTTVTTLLHQIMSAAGRESGLIGTVETRIGDEVIASKRTTPESSDLQALSAVMRERHMRNLVMEVSSHAIALERVRGSHFAVVAFTNLSQDHLDFHKTMQAYFEAKAKLFTFEFADLAVINIDDAYGVKLAEQTELPVMTVSRHDQSATWHFAAISKDYVGAHVAIRGSGGILIEGKVHLHGGYNFDNLLMAVAIATESGIDPIDIAAILPQLTGAAGRLESVRLGQNFTALVDYAHSPDAVTNVLDDLIPDISLSPSTSLAVEVPVSTTSVSTTSFVPPHYPVFALGDSVMKGAAPTLAELGIVVDAVQDRQGKMGADIFIQLQDLGVTMDAVVIHLGTNGPMSQKTLDSMMDAVAGVPRVVILTGKANRDWTDKNNKKIRALPSAYPNVVVLDWELIATLCEGRCLTADGIHLDSDGMIYYSAEIWKALGREIL